MFSLARGNRLEDLDPAQFLKIQVAPGLSLLGYTLTPDPQGTNGDFSLSLDWTGTDKDAKATPVTVRWRDAAGHDYSIEQTMVTPPPAGRGLCSFFDLQLPATATPGKGALLINDSKLTDFELKR